MFKEAIEGVVYVLKNERNMKVHLLISILVIITAFMLELEVVRIALLFITIVCVIVAEMFNTAIELICDSIEEEYSLKIKLIKDVSAGAVFITALFSISMAVLIFIMQ